MDIIPFDDRDGKIWFNGEMVEWRDAKTHVLNHVYIMPVLSLRGSVHIMDAYLKMSGIRKDCVNLQTFLISKFLIQMKKLLKQSMPFSKLTGSQMDIFVLLLGAEAK